MKFLTISKILMILILPFLLVMIVLNFAGLDSSFYLQKFSEYGISRKFPEASSMHDKVMGFIKGENNELPSQFNERERQHLWDVRSAIRLSTIILYALIALFMVLLIASSFTLKINNFITNFIGKVLVFGGFLTIILAAALLFLINYDFSSAFESFHRLFFQKGTYLFDPTKEMIVSLYPQQLFMDLGIKISKWVIAASAATILLGGFLLLKSKSKKNKYDRKKFGF